MKASQATMEESYRTAEDAITHVEGLASPAVVSVVKSLASSVQAVHALSVEFVKLSVGEVQTVAARERTSESDAQLVAEVSADLGAQTTPETGSHPVPLAIGGVLMLLVGLAMESRSGRRRANVGARNGD